MKESTVPRINLAPKLRRDLSLWNPFDYLLLLYWVFYFPQAVRWYVETRDGGDKLKEQKTWRDRIQFLRDHPVQLRLRIQYLLLTVIIVLIICSIAANLGLSVNWGDVLSGAVWGALWGAVSGAVLGAVFAVVGGAVSGVALGVVFGVFGVFGAVLGAVLGVLGAMWGAVWGGVLVMAWGGVWLASRKTRSGVGELSSVWFWVVWGVALGVVFGVFGVLGAVSVVVWGVVRGVLLGVVLGVGLVFLGVALGVVGGAESVAESVVVLGVVSGAVSGLAFGVGFGVVFGVFGVSGVSGAVSGLAFGVVLGVVFIFAFFRPDNWLIGLLAGHQGRLFPRITLLPLPGLTSTLQQWLQQDWETAINNLNQYLRYSRQFIPVLAAVNRVLPQFPEAEILYRVSRLAENPSDWQLLKCASAKPFFFPDSQIRLDTPARAAAAGFWYLHQQDTEKAETAFAVVRSLAYGEEMYSLAQTLHRFSQAATFDSIASLEVAPIAAEPSLRPQTWQAISSLNRVIAEVALVQRSRDRIIGELSDIIDRQAANLPLAEKALILSIAQKWKTCCSSSL
ncbi:hypothetical protein [Microcystis sp. LE18-22.4A]|uniref:hypothetical protein n=1 Tax=Microcystis sp. LE18-22.4A TaxID=3016432 RepID=UPI00338E0DE3